MKNIAICVLAFLACAVALDVLQIVGTVRDFTPQTCADFEGTATGDDLAIPQGNEDVFGLPIYNNAVSHATVTSALTYAEWYRDVSGVNIPITVTLELDGDESGTYTYDADNFFPIDNIGYGNYGNTGHNYHFTTAFQTTFVYQGDEVFSFTGNDDFWIFINGILVADLGGVHVPETVSITLSSLNANLVLGANNTFDIFHAQRHTPTSDFHIATTVLFNAFQSFGSSNPGRVASICEVIYPNFCPGSPIPPGDQDSDSILPSKKSETFGMVARQNTCPDDPTITFPDGSTYSFDGFNVISFSDYDATTGDVQGRAAMRNNLNVGAGYSFGYELRTGGASAWDTPYPFSLVIGRAGTFVSGAVYPDGSNSPYTGPKENIFAGTSFSSTQSDLESRVTETCGSNPGCLDADFDNAQAYYTLLQADFAAVADNAVYAVQYGGLNVTCHDVTQTSYSLTIQEVDFNILTYYNAFINCNPSAQFVLNVAGSDDVYFNGNNQQFFPAEKFLYNILGVGRTIHVNTEVDGSILAPNNIINQPSGVIIGIVIAADVTKAWQINRLHCTTPAPQPHVNNTVNLCPSFESACEGLDFPLDQGVFSFRDFNVITFSDFIADTGDIEGRLAAQDDVHLGSGFSIGAALSYPQDNLLPYSVVVGRDLTWGSGAIYPNQYSDMPEEFAFVGGSFTQTNGNDLYSQVTGGPCGVPGCLDLYFNEAQACYEGFQSVLASSDDNVNVQILWDALIITCNDDTESIYYVSITPDQMTQYTYTSLSNCNYQADWVINIRGTGDVSLTGGSFPSVPGAAVYNIIGSGRTITVTDTEVNGHVLAPQNTLYQPGGVIQGKVVAANISMSLQINKQNVCPNPANVSIPVPTNGSSTPSDNSSEIPLTSFAAFAPGDKMFYNGGDEFTTILQLLDNNGPVVVVDGSIAINEGSQVFVIGSNLEGRPSSYNKPTSDASLVSISIALLIVILAIVF